jgi:hypothetical protein
VTRLSTRARRLAFFVAVIAATVLVSACGPGPAPTVGADSSVMGSSSPAAGVSGRVDASNWPPASSPAAALPQGWRLCTNGHVGYSIGYPADWYTTALRNEEVCSQFHPTSFTIPQFSEYPLTALNVGRASERPATPTDPRYARTLLWEETLVGVRGAIRFEEEFTGEGLYEKGTMRYGYVTDPNGRALTVYTIASPGTASYADWKVVVDQAVRTLDARIAV